MNANRATPSNPGPTHARPYPAPTLTPRAFSCQCGRPVFFSNTDCLACGTPLGYAPDLMRLLPLEPADPVEPVEPVEPSPAAAGPDAASVVEPPEASAPAPTAPTLWREYGAGDEAPRFRRCANLLSAAVCNWLIDEDDAHAGEPAQCRCCRLNRTLPDLSVAENLEPWHRIETAKRRLVSSLIALKLPVQSRVSEDPEQGLAFDLLRALPGGPKVTTGHADGVITLDIAEADDAVREQRRLHLNEPYRTLLGHLRHESGHYYWQRLVLEQPAWLEGFRHLFGDERDDYAAALKAHYENGPRADWGSAFVTAYAGSHAWEDWAETWAHYLHMVDTVDTAASFGLDATQLDLNYDPFTPHDLAEPDVNPEPGADPEARAFLALIQGWMELTGVLNELSRSMGLQDFYPFVLPLPAVRKLYFVHRLVHGGAAPASAASAAPEAASAAPKTPAPAASAAGPAAPARGSRAAA